MSEKLVGDMKEAIRNGDSEAAKRAADLAVSEGIDLTAAIKELSAVMAEIGERFSRLEIFLTDLMMSGEAMKTITDVFAPVLRERKLSIARIGKIVIGTVRGDIHDIGKTLTAASLDAAAFEVHDLGVDVTPIAFIEKARDVGADMIGLSALMTTTMPYQHETIRLLEEMKLRSKYRVVVGGGPTTREWAREIGADEYGKDCTEAVRICKKIMEVR